MHSVIFLHIFFLFLGERLFRGYKELCTHTDRLAEISHIVFVVHGVGQVITFSHYRFKLERILKGCLDLIPSPSPSVKIQIMGGKVCLRCKGKTLLGVVNKLLKTKSLFTKPSNVLPLHLKQTFPFIIWVFVEVEGDVSKSRIPFKIFPTLWINTCIENTWYSHVQIFYYKSFKKHLKICIRWFPSSIY